MIHKIYQYLLIPKFFQQLTLSKLCFASLLLGLLNFQGCGFFEDEEAKFKKLDEKAASYFDANQMEEARISLQSAIKLKPKKGNLYYRLAEVFVRQKKFKEAVENYRNAIDLEPGHRKANLHLAALFLVAGEEEQAESYVNKVLERDKNDKDALAVMANLHSKRRNFDKADSILDQILELDPKSVTALAGKADISLSRNNYKGAEAYLNLALEIDPSNRPIQLAVVDLYVKQGRFDDAEALLASLVNQDPDNSSLRYYFGEFLLTRGSSKDSIEHFEATVEAEPKRHRARDRLYDIYLFNKRPEDAKKLLPALEAKLPNDAALPYFRGRNLELVGNYKEALKNYISSIKSLPNFAPAFRRAGIAELKEGDIPQGLEHLNQAIAIDSYDVGARLSLAQHFFRQKKISTASEHVEKVLERFPFQIGANILRADIALVEGDTNKAQTLYQVLLKNYPNSPTGYLKMGLLQEKKGNKEEALKFYKSAIEKDIAVWLPLRRYVNLLTNKEGAEQASQQISLMRDSSKKAKAEFSVVLAQLALTGISSKDEASSSMEKAKEHLNKAILDNENFLPAYSMLAQLDAMRGDLDASIANYQKAVEIKPEQYTFRLLLAMSLERKGLLEEAAKEYRTILKDKPRFGPAANNLAWLLAENLKGDLDEAQKLAQIAKEAMPKEGAVADTLGWIYHKKGSSRAALSYIEEAIASESAGESTKVNPEILYHLGVVKKSLGDKQGAVEAFNKALSSGGEKYPRKSEIEKMIKELS